MPTTYAHDRFGKQVEQLVPEEIQQAIRQYPMIYRIGLHGADILFYYHPWCKNEVVSQGHRVHREKAAVFFNHAATLQHATGSVRMLSYLCGFACHYALDRACHPMVYACQDQYGLTHSEIETCLDGYLMEQDGLHPRTYLPAHELIPNAADCETIGFVLHRPAKIIRHSIAGQRFFTAIQVPRRIWLQWLLARIPEKYAPLRELKGRIMHENFSRNCHDAVAKLLPCYEQALVDAPAIVAAVVDLCHTGQELPSSFNYNFLKG